jgi:DNA-binding beta-propeller fold protein YncE/mono/diheme cytochrome c family protein
VPAPAALAAPLLSVREGGALVRSPAGDALYLADEDHAVLRRIPLPIDEASPPRAFPLPGRPAQVLGVGSRVLVTIRDPGLLLVLRDDKGKLSEETRVALPADAWGLAVTADGQRALISSAWAHRLSLVDLATARVTWSAEVAREPRGVVLRGDGSAAYVTHLVGTALTEVEQLDTDAPLVRRVALPAAPLRSAWNEMDRTSASLGYAAVSSPDQRRLFVARHALGSLGWGAWFGSSTVDVLATPSNEPVAPARLVPGVTSSQRWGSISDRGGFLPDTEVAPFIQPRAMVLRSSTGTLLVAGEGNDVLSELDAEAAAPALAPLRTYVLAGPERRVELYDFPQHGAKIPVSACGAPSGVALSVDEQTAYVYCRSTDGLAVVPLVDHRTGPAPRPYRRNETYLVARLAESPLPEPEAAGRRFFYDAIDPVMSGGLACAGCHPEGRDDGFVWRELHAEKQRPPSFVATAAVLAASDDTAAGLTLGRPRQTPMLAGRVSAPGPYGWLAESADLPGRIRQGFALHRWRAFPTDGTTQGMRAEPLAAFLREGLLPPPARTGELDASEKRGQEIFAGESAACARCHTPETAYTNHLAMPLPVRRSRAAFDSDPAPAFKVPSLFYVGSTAPYFHDGSAATLEDLVEQNLDRMGMTSQLSADERRDLLAFLRTIEPPARASAPAREAVAVAWKPAMMPALPPDLRGPEGPLVAPALRPGLASVNIEPWPAAPSPEPSKVEWTRAPEVQLARQSEGCDVKRIREWIRVHCVGDNHVTLLGGQREGVRVVGAMEVESQVIFPVRRGDRRVFQLGGQWKWMTPKNVLSEQWIAGESAPVLTIDALYSPSASVMP